MKGYCLTYRVGRATVTEPYCCAECAGDAESTCGCFSLARARARDIDRPHEITRNGRLLSFTKTFGVAA